MEIDRYARIDDLLAIHINKTFIKNQTINNKKPNNRKTRQKPKHIASINIETNDINEEINEEINQEINEEINGILKNEHELNDKLIEELLNDLTDDESSLSDTEDTETFNENKEDFNFVKNKPKSYIFKSSDLENKLNKLTVLLNCEMNTIKNIKKFLHLENYIKNNIHLKVHILGKEDILDIIKLNLIKCGDEDYIPLYTREDYYESRDKIKQYRQTIDRYQKSIDILNSSDALDIEDNTELTYEDILRIFE